MGENLAPPEDPAREGYDFAGWDPPLPEKYPEKDTKYTAKWVKEGDYTITYELDGGTNVPENPASYNVETETITLKDPVKPGYTFGGWYMAEDFTGDAVTEIVQGTTGDITLYAKWELVSYTITYELNGGINVPENPTSYNVETETITLKDPAKPGYTFAGWYMAEDFTGDAVTEIAQGTTGNITLYAKWLENYTITYELNGGINVPENPTGYNVETETITLKDPAKTGYTFAGWYKDAEFTTQVTEITQGTTGNITLYAKWELESYTITYELDGGTNAPENPASYNVETETITLKAPTKDKYDFKGWYKDGEFTDEITEIPQGTTGDITLYAKWELESYTITYELDGGTNASENPPSYNMETETITLKDPAKPGYSFGGWYMAEDFTGVSVTGITQGSTGNITLYAKWELVSYTITYELNGGTNAPENPPSYNVETETITLKDPVKPGYSFGGWYMAEDFTGVSVTGITQGSTGDITLYAKWLENYTITYELNGGTNAPENPAGYNVETGTITLKDPAKPGYTFAGWYMAEDFTGVSVTGITQGSTGDITLYAKWEPVSYTITYELEGGTNAPENPPSYNVETETITLKDPAKPGYTFAGWYMAEDFTGNAVTEIVQGTTGNITLYAKWVPVSYTITYELNGGTNASENPASYNVETETITLKDPVKTGYTFAGWYSADNSPVTKIPQGSTGDITLYAKWIEIIVPETLEVKGGNCTLNGKKVTLSSFWISTYEVTQEEFVSIMTGNTNGIEANPSYFPDNPAEGEVQERRPVENVNWYDAIVYCNLLSIKEGLTPCYTIKGSTTPADWGISPTSKSAGDYADWESVTCNFNADGYRLPTEAEWEYAARGGKAGITDGSWNNTYSGSNTAGNVAWYSHNSDDKTHEVGKKRANALGLYDMSGNVEEWCWDWYGSSSYPSGTEDPAGPDTGSSRVLRGGGWGDYASYRPVSNRGFGGNPCLRNGYYGNGFRLVRSAR